MSCKIIKDRERVNAFEYKLCFDIDESGGYAFDCDSNGKICDDMNECAKENYKWCLEHPEKFIRKPYIRKDSWTYVEPAIAKCHCGEEFQLVDEYMGSCECPKCGQVYNLFGQELLPWDQWEEDERW